MKLYHVIADGVHPRNQWERRPDGLYALSGSAYAFRDDQVRVCTAQGYDDPCACALPEHAPRHMTYPLGDESSGRGYRVRPCSTPGLAYVVAYTFESERPCGGVFGRGVSVEEAHAYAARMSGRAS